MTQSNADNSRCLEYLCAMQAVALAGAKLFANVSPSEQTQTKLIEMLNWFIHRSEQLSIVQGNLAGTMKDEESLQKICDILHELIDMMSYPLSFKHLCKVQIRRSLGRDFHRKLNQINMPLSLKLYLTIYDHDDIIIKENEN